MIEGIPSLFQSNEYNHSRRDPGKRYVRHQKRGLGGPDLGLETENRRSCQTILLHDPKVLDRVRGPLDGRSRTRRERPKPEE